MEQPWIGNMVDGTHGTKVEGSRPQETWVGECPLDWGGPLLVPTAGIVHTYVRRPLGGLG